MVLLHSSLLVYYACADWEKKEYFLHNMWWAPFLPQLNVSAGLNLFPLQAAQLHSSLSICELPHHQVEWVSELAATHYHCDRREEEANLPGDTCSYMQMYMNAGTETHGEWEETVCLWVGIACKASLRLFICSVFVYCLYSGKTEKKHTNYWNAVFDHVPK